MAAQADGSGRRRQALVAAGWIFAAAVATAAFAAWIVSVTRTTWEEPKCSVAVAAVAGLDPARDLSDRGRPALSPALNVTVHIDNTANTQSSYDFGSDCVRDLSTAAVSYGDALLGRGTVPAFCARPREVAESVARAWGEDVVVPWFLRDQLAGELAVGEATVDVQLRTPKLFICKAKIGGGLSPCRRPE